MIIIANQYKELLNLKDKKLAIFELTKLIMLILFFGHLIGCLLVLIAFKNP